jgi:hypothetical protein
MVTRDPEAAMRKTMILMLTASIAAALACSDRSPTSPMGATTASSESTEAPALKTAARPRNVIVVPARGDKPLPPGVWGSAEASLTIREGGATLEILSEPFSPTGACFGRYGDVGPKIPNGRFFLPGTYTQLMGAYPGKIDYRAQYSGVVVGNTLSISIEVPGLQQSFGPFVLVQGVSSSWTPCLYP